MAQMTNKQNFKPIIDAARQWIEKCLIEDKSIFSDGLLWTKTNIEEVRSAFVDHPDAGKDSFSIKLHGQMENTSPDAKRLMAEMIWALLLFPSNIKSSTKRMQIASMWELSGGHLSEKHPMLADDLISGIGSGGPGFNNHRWREIGYLIALAGDFKKRSATERVNIFSEYDSFMNWIQSVKQDGRRQFRHMLRYFSFPDRVERMTSNKHRWAILAEYGVAPLEVVNKWSDKKLDEELFALRQKLSAEHPNEKLDFYEEPLRERWLNVNNDTEGEENEEIPDVKHRFWVEKTLVAGRPDRQEGDNALGKALWSPQKASGNRDLYRCMREVKKGDIVFHLVDNKHLIGISVAAAEADAAFMGVDGTEWGHRPCYRIPLTDYRVITPPIHRSDFLTSVRYNDKISGILERHHGLFFNRELNLNQGSYITEAPLELVQLWDEIFREKSGETLLPGVDLGAPETSRSVQSARGALLDAQVIDDFEKALNEAGFKASRDFIVRFMAALASKRFMLLTGLSGSGKTQLAQAFARWVSPSKESYRLVAVGADWTNNEALLGYVDALMPKSYRKPESGVLDIVLKARKDKNLPFFIVMDEMNLSHVERYFADFLSCMESDGEICLHEGDESDLWDGVPGRIKMPENVFVIGTVNVDETTYMFSPKVLDRANVIEFRVSRDEMEGFLKTPKKTVYDRIDGRGIQYAKPLAAAAVDRSLMLDDSVRESVAKILMEYFPALKEVGAEFGYRTAHEICRFVHFHKILSGEGWRLEDAMDAAIMQKLLPKLHGSKKKLGPVLDKLSELCMGRFAISTEKIERMQKRLAEHGFTSFAEA